MTGSRSGNIVCYDLRILSSKNLELDSAIYCKGRFERNCVVCNLVLQWAEFIITTTLPSGVIKFYTAKHGKMPIVLLSKLVPVERVSTYTCGRGKNKGKEIPMNNIYGVIAEFTTGIRESDETDLLLDCFTSGGIYEIKSQELTLINQG